MPLEYSLPVSITQDQQRIYTIPNLPPAKMKVYPISEPPPIIIIFPEWHRLQDLETKKTK
jgi:hypothetical protein